MKWFDMWLRFRSSVNQHCAGQVPFCRSSRSGLSKTCRMRKTFATALRINVRGRCIYLVFTDTYTWCVFSPTIVSNYGVFVDAVHFGSGGLTRMHSGAVRLSAVCMSNRF